jgi:hypothetical protein
MLATTARDKDYPGTLSRLIQTSAVNRTHQTRWRCCMLAATQKTKSVWQPPCRLSTRTVSRAPRPPWQPALRVATKRTRFTASRLPSARGPVLLAGRPQYGRGRHPSCQAVTLKRTSGRPCPEPGGGQQAPAPWPTRPHSSPGTPQHGRPVGIAQYAVPPRWPAAHLARACGLRAKRGHRGLKPAPPVRATAPNLTAAPLNSGGRLQVG